MDKKKIIGTLLVIFSIGTLFYGAHYFGKKAGERRIAEEMQRNIAKTNQEAKSNISQKGESISQENESRETNADKKEKEENIKMVSEPEDIREGYIEWNSPKNLGDIGLTDKNFYDGCTECGQDKEYYYTSRGVKYFKVGKVKKGKYEDYDLILVESNVYNGPAGGGFFRILKKGNDVIFLFDKSYGISLYERDMIDDVFSKGDMKKVFNDKIRIEELEYPEDLSGPEDRQVLKKVAFNGTFFSSRKLKRIFIDKKYGQVWMTDISKLSGEKRDIFDRSGFYLKSSDGLAVVYKLKLDIFNKQDREDILDVTWNKGEKNDTAYEFAPSGCGGGSYVYETSITNTNKDLVVIGKTSQGDKIYGPKSADSEIFKSFIDHYYNKGKGESSEEIFGFHPEVFWKDPFGRVLAFYNTDFIVLAECGKPVIYLYPGKPMNVSVKVAPGNGFSYTDPEYGNGWNVFSDTESNLTNLSDGKKYPYLFWEGSSDVYYEMPKQGFVAKADELDKFFNDKLTEFGLIKKEISDFKEFWIPKMQEGKNPYFFITFLSKSYIDELAPLSVEPKPDTIIRVLMDYRGLDSYRETSDFKIKTPERKGFTVVEWGGMINK